MCVRYLSTLLEHNVMLCASIHITSRKMRFRLTFFNLYSSFLCVLNFFFHKWWRHIYEMVIKPDVMPVFRFMLHLQWNGRRETLWHGKGAGFENFFSLLYNFFLFHTLTKNKTDCTNRITIKHDYISSTGYIFFSFYQQTIL